MILFTVLLHLYMGNAVSIVCCFCERQPIKVAPANNFATTLEVCAAADSANILDLCAGTASSSGNPDDATVR